MRTLDQNNQMYQVLLWLPICPDPLASTLQGQNQISESFILQASVSKVHCKTEFKSVDNVFLDYLCFKVFTQENVGGLQISMHNRNANCRA